MVRRRDIASGFALKNLSRTPKFNISSGDDECVIENVRQIYDTPFICISRVSDLSADAFNIGSCEVERAPIQAPTDARSRQDRNEIDLFLLSDLTVGATAASYVNFQLN